MTWPLVTLGRNLGLHEGQCPRFSIRRRVTVFCDEGPQIDRPELAALEKVLSLLIVPVSPNSIASKIVLLPHPVATVDDEKTVRELGIHGAWIGLGELGPPDGQDVITVVETDFNIPFLGRGPSPVHQM